MAHEDSTIQKTRGKGFPSLPLDEAHRAVSNAGKYGREHSLAAFAGYLGHDSTNSGPFRSKMAALRDWGLIERSGGEQVRLSDLAHHLAHPSSPTEEADLLREAFFKAEPFAAVYNDSAKETDLSIDFIGNRAVTALGIAAKSKQKFADSFVRSVVTAGLGRSGSKGSVHLIPPGADQAPEEDDSAHVEETPPALLLQRPAGGAASPDTGIPRAVHQEWEVADGAVLFEVRLTKPLPGAAFAGLAEIMTTIEAFVASLSSPPATTADAADVEAADAAE